MAHRHHPARADDGEAGTGQSTGRDWARLGPMTWLAFTPLLQAGAHVRDDAVANLTQLIGGAQELHAYSVRRLYTALAHDISQVPVPSPQARLFLGHHLPAAQFCVFPRSHDYPLGARDTQGQGYF